MLNGAKGVANDACLYGEDTVIRLLNQSIQGDTGAKVQSALRYYREPSARAAVCVCLAGSKQGLQGLQTGPLDNLVPFGACFHEGRLRQAALPCLPCAVGQDNLMDSNVCVGVGSGAQACMRSEP